MLARIMAYLEPRLPMTRSEHRRVLDDVLADMRKKCDERIAATNRRHKTELANANARAERLIKSGLRVIPDSDFRYSHGVRIEISDQMMKHMATYGDESLWRYESERIGAIVEHELKTMNFAGFNQYINEAEWERRRNHVGPLFHG